MWLVDRIELALGHQLTLGVLADRLAELSYLLSDLATDVASYAGGLESDPSRLATVQERRAALTALMRKYGQTVDDVFTYTAMDTTGRTASSTLTVHVQGDDDAPLVSVIPVQTGDEDEPLTIDVLPMPSASVDQRVEPAIAA